jgi:hypothetical protein
MIKDKEHSLKQSDNEKTTWIFTSIQEENDCTPKVFTAIRVWFNKIKKHTNLHI